jgi:tetratricopeptide (TPR) repeat protein
MDVRESGPAVWKVGDIIRDDYAVTGILGEGGMGIVYKIYHRSWGMVMAVKSPKSEIFVREGGKENFIREAETWVSLGTYPHLVSCHFVETLGGTPRIFAEYVEGGSLVDWIRRRRLYEGGPEQALERILDVSIQFAWGLHFAHAQGIVHQDIKPANVMMTPDGIAKVTDFGLAKARMMAGEQGALDGKGVQSILVSSNGMTPAYCSPEQVAGQAISRKTDIWSWGLSVLEMFTGEVTWAIGAAAQEILAGHEVQDQAIPAVPAALRNLLKRCFQQSPEARPATMLEVATELQEIYASLVGCPYSRAMPDPAVTQVSSLINRGNSLLHLGRLEEAADVSKQAIRLDPESADAYYNLGGAYQELGRQEEALVAYDQAIRLKPNDVEAHNHRGAVLMRLGRSEEALAACEQALHFDPNFASAHYNRGLMLEMIGRPEEALEALECAFLDPNFVKFAPAYYRAGLALTDLGRPKEALAAFELAIRLDPNYALAYMDKGFALTRLGRSQEALAAIQQATRLDHNLASAYYIGIALRLAGHLQEALDRFEQVIRLVPNDALAYFNKGLALAGLGRLAMALAAYEQTIRLNPDYIPAYFNRGSVLAELGRPEEALAAFEQTIRLNSRHARAYTNKGGILARLGRPEEALVALEEALRLNPNDAYGYMNKLFVLIRLGRQQEAMDALHQAVSLDPSLAQHITKLLSSD